MTIDEGGVVSDSIDSDEGQFDFDIVMRADADLIQEYTGSRVIGDMNYFTVRFCQYLFLMIHKR